MDEEVGEEADKEVKEVTNGEWAFLYSNKSDIHLTLQDLNSHNIDKSVSEIIQKNFNIDEPKPNLQSWKTNMLSCKYLFQVGGNSFATSAL